MNNIKAVAHKFAVELAEQGKVSYENARQICLSILESNYGQRMTTFFNGLGTNSQLPSLGSLLPSNVERDEFSETSLSLIKGEGAAIIGTASLAACIWAIFIGELILAIFIAIIAYMEIKAGSNFINDAINQLKEQIKVF